MIAVYITLATAALAFGTAYLGLMASRKNGNKISEVHVLVNSRLTTVVDRVEQLKNVLAGHDIAIPPAMGDSLEHPILEGVDPAPITNIDRDNAAKAGEENAV